MSLGFDPDSFWRLTPRELTWRAKAANRRLVREHNEGVRLAHLNARLSHADPKHFPDIKRLLVPEHGTARRRQSPAEMLAILRVMAAVMK